ncbi:hypothetical protein M9458_054875 [Cirrhinus mrigala]|uniref:ribonuclease H n=1 Tax=Cirrhinus mrigala TaxID=683832 RepID=A0ABD0ML84_CIRMR
MEGAVQHEQVLDHWPMPPLLLPEDSLMPEVEEAEVELAPLPWPSSNYPPNSAVVEEQRVVIVIDRMMSELQLMRDSMTSSITAHTRPHSTPRNLNLSLDEVLNRMTGPQPRGQRHLTFAAQNLSNLLPVDAPELFKYQILVDHVKLEDACLIADSFINSPRPYTDTMAALTKKFGQPHHVALKRIAAVMDSPEIKRGDSAAFERFSLHVQSLVGMLQTLGPDGEVELKCGSHVARLLTKLPIEMRANFRRQMFHRPGHTHTLLDLAEWLRYESWCQGYDNQSDICTSGQPGYRAEKRRSKPIAMVLHGAESATSNQGVSQGGQSSSAQRWKGKVKPYCPYCEGTEHFLNKCPAIQKLTRGEVIEWIKVNKRVLLRNRDRTLDTYAILDDRSERTMLLPEAVEKLGLHKKPEDLALRTICQEVQTLKGATVSFKISSPTNAKRIFRIAEAFTSQRLGLADHSYPIASLKRRYKHLADLPLESFVQVKPLVLIGADYPHLLTPVIPVRLGPPGGPAAIRTRLGWTLQGPADFTQWGPSIQQCLFTSVSSQLTELMQNVEKLWKMDVLPYQSSKLAVRSKQDKEALELLEARTRRVQVAGIPRYAMPLLRKQGVPPLRAPKEAVLPSLRSLERRLTRDPLRAVEYCAAIWKLVESVPVRRIDPSEASATDESWYIPHHLVSHNGKSRLVFNCSFQFQGPTLRASLLGVLLRFREHAVAVSGDIRGMFHQVRLLPEDQPLLRFIWRDMKHENPPDIFQWQVLPFGTVCSPCCATFALQRHAREHGGPGAGIQHSVEHCFYVDNCLQSVHTAEEAKELVDRLRVVLASGGFKLRQWACNIPYVLRHLPAEARSDSMERWLSHDEPGLSEPALGLSWHWGSDTLSYKSRPLAYGALMMRNVYKVMARQYDPLGFIAPFTTRARLIVQSMWDKPCDWDDPCIPQDLQKAWMEWESELHLLPRISVPRPYAPALTEQMVASRQIHVFSDASERVYGSVSCLRTEDVQRRVNLAFLAARSRVAPQRQHSIPRLKLCGALTAAQLAKTIERELTVKTDKTILWSDSTTVLTWLQSESCCFKVFVRTCVAEIQELTAESTWRYVDSAQNPADDVPRGKTLTDLALPNR